MKTSNRSANDNFRELQSSKTEFVSAGLEVGLGAEFEDEIDFDIPEETPRISRGRIVGTVFFGIAVSFVLCVVVLYLYTKWVRFPKEAYVDFYKTGMYCLENYEESLYSMESTGKDSYIALEIVYANNNEDKVNFYKKMLSFVKYTPQKVNAKNIYGNDFIDKSTGSTVLVDSPVDCGEEVILSYIDYDKIKVDKTLLKEIMSKNEVALGDVDYNNKLINVFLEYMLTVDEFPIKEVLYTPSMEYSDGKYSILGDEDIYIDKLLFSSSEFYSFLDRFSVVAGEVSKGVTIEPTEEWVKWDELSSTEKEENSEPEKYNYKEVINKHWCGTYFLKNEYVSPEGLSNVVAEVGNGTFDSPASYNTSILTNVYIKEKDEDGNLVSNSYPIRIELVDYGVSEDAIKWFEGKDIRNRGIDINSELQYCYFCFKITNLSDKKLTIHDNIGICDANANLAPRTGVIYGLKNKLVLNPDESGVLESWNSNTKLNKKYVIWGADFDRRESPVWFRLLQGNLEDESEDKGVTLNKTRDSD